jgi:hypothetical protein
MGGPGSGNHDHGWRSGKKTVVEDCLQLKTSDFTRGRILTAGVSRPGTLRWVYRSGGEFAVNYEVNTLDPAAPFVRLWYSWVWSPSGQQGSAAYRLFLTATCPAFGGVRWWFVCPLSVDGSPCRRRVGKLYLPPRSGYFGCRHCHGLTYTSCQESHKFDRLERRIAGNLGCTVEDVRRALDRLGK